jgi:hypothetical protein
MNNQNTYILLSVTVPEEIVPVPLPVPQGIPKSNYKTEFTLIRTIANVALFHRRDISKGYFNNPIPEFDPPIEFEVVYTRADVAALQEDETILKLAYWSEEHDKWVIIYEFEPDMDVIISSVLVPIESWVGDPTLGWGR